MIDSRYLKLNVNWMDSDWLVVLSAEARLAWVQMLCYVKMAGLGGRVKAKSAEVFARQNYLGVEAVEQMIRAAMKDGALTIDDGCWVITGWEKHQGDATAADRQRRYRERNALRDGVTTEDNEEEKREDAGESSRTHAVAARETWTLLPDTHKVKSVGEALNAYFKMRSEYEYRVWKPGTCKTNAKNLSALTPEEAAACLNSSATNAYQGLFPEKFRGKGKTAHLTIVDGADIPEGQTTTMTAEKIANVMR